MKPDPIKQIVDAITAIAVVARRAGVQSVHVEVPGIGPLDLHLGPLPPPELVAPPAPVRPIGPAQMMARRFHESATGMPMDGVDHRLRQRHETMFAASSVRPRIDAGPATTTQSVVPRAVRAREAAAKGGSKKRSKR